MGLFGKGKNDSTKKVKELRKELRKLVKKKKYDEALKSGLKVLETLPHENDVLFIVGGIYYMRNQLKTAITYFDRALEIGEYDVQVLLLKANSHFKLGEIKKSKLCCEKIKEIDSKNKGLKELEEEFEKQSD